jgi:hypothetical protein
MLFRHCHLQITWYMYLNIGGLARDLVSLILKLILTCCWGNSHILQPYLMKDVKLH